MLLNKSSLSFDEKKQVEDLLNKRKELDDLVKQIQSDNKKNLYNRQQMEQNKELLEQQKQIENLLNNVLDPKTKELLQRLQQLMQLGQKNDTRDELSKNEYRQQIA
jgi:Spy/CpxP family protein refolding chaperone